MDDNHEQWHESECPHVTENVAAERHPYEYFRSALSKAVEGLLNIAPQTDFFSHDLDLIRLDIKALISQPACLTLHLPLNPHTAYPRSHV